MACSKSEDFFLFLFKYFTICLDFLWLFCLFVKQQYFLLIPLDGSSKIYMSAKVNKIDPQTLSQPCTCDKQFPRLPQPPGTAEKLRASEGGTWEKNGFLGTCPFPSNLPLSLPYAFPHSNPIPTPTQFLLYSTFFLTPPIPTPSGDLRWRKKSGCLGFEEGKKNSWMEYIFRSLVFGGVGPRTGSKKNIFGRRQEGILR